MFGKPYKRTAWRHLGAAALACGLLTLQTGCRAEQPWPLYQQYRARFIDGQGRVVDHDPAAGDHTTSEGMAYAMFFAIVDNDRSTFDKLQRWTEDNLAGGDMTARLPSWNWGKNDKGEWKTLDPNSAGDADLWMAYDFLEAGRLWKDDKLTRLGEVMMNRIALSEVALAPNLGTVLLPGPQGFRPHEQMLIINPSYMPPEILARLKAQQPGGPWASILQTFPQLIQASSPAGYAMDWTIADANGTRASGNPGEIAQGKGDAVPIGSYDAIRTYLWLGMADHDTEGVSASLNALPAMARYLQGSVTPPLQVSVDGHVINPEGTTGFSAAVIPYLTALGRKNEAKAQENRLKATYDTSSGFYGRSAEYYDQNLALFATGWQEGRFRFEKDGKLKLKWK